MENRVTLDWTKAAPETISWLRRLGAIAAMLAVYHAIQLCTLVLEVYPRLGLREDLAARGSWVQLTDHHFWQMSLALLAIAVLARGRIREWGLNTRNWRDSLRITRAFLFYYGVWFVGVGVLLKLFVIGPPPIDHPWTADHIVGRLAFGFLLVGVSEEILFRGLIHTWLARFWTGTYRVRSVDIPTAGVAAALIFTVAHIQFSLSPFGVASYSVPQLVQALALGLLYSWAYHRTGSLVAPILMHNASDGLLWLGDYMVIGLLS